MTTIIKISAQCVNIGDVTISVLIRIVSAPQWEKLSYRVAVGQAQGHLALLTEAASKCSSSQTTGRVYGMEPSQLNVAETGHKVGKGRALQSVCWWGCPVAWVRTHFDPEEQRGTARTRGQTLVSSLWFLLLRILSRWESQLVGKKLFQNNCFLFHKPVYYPTLL